jgi:hypothetical protein
VTEIAAIVDALMAALGYSRYIAQVGGGGVMVVALGGQAGAVGCGRGAPVRWCASLDCPCPCLSC